MIITSPGNDKTTPCYTELRDAAVKNLEGIIDNDRELDILFELDGEDEWDNIEMLPKSNPMMPYVKTLRPYLEERIKEAKIYGGAKAANIKIKNCGVWIDSPSVWIPSETIKANRYDIPDDDLLGMPCYGGLDLSAGGDLNAFVLVFPGDVTVVKSWFWIPKSKLLSQKEDAVDYRKWVESGHMEVFEGVTVEYDKIAAKMIQEMDKYDVQALAVDPKYFSTGPVIFFKDTKYLQLIDKIGQTYTNLAGATEKVEQMAKDHKFDFGGHPVMQWNFACVELRVGDQGDRMPSKGRSKGRIDGVAALVTAMSRWLQDQTKQTEFFADVW
jgi:phage terminase large subunit-like protein